MRYAYTANAQHGLVPTGLQVRNHRTFSTGVVLS
jgi:hypothetical protein